MKINSTAFGIKNSAMVKRPEGEQTKAHVDPASNVNSIKGNTDKIIISGQGAKKAENDQLAKAIVNNIERPASAERIAALQEAVKDNSYYVPTKDLADALVQRWIGL